MARVIQTRLGGSSRGRARRWMNGGLVSRQRSNGLGSASGTSEISCWCLWDLSKLAD